MPEQTNISSGSGSRDPLFKEQPREKSFPTAAVSIAAVVVVVVIVALLVVGRRGSGPAGGAAYAANLELTNLQPSQSESLSGGRSTYLDGHIVNHGNQTVTGVTVQAVFRGGWRDAADADRAGVGYPDTAALCGHRAAERGAAGSGRGRGLSADL